MQQYFTTMMIVNCIFSTHDEMNAHVQGIGTLCKYNGKCIDIERKLQWVLSKLGFKLLNFCCV